jgi:hypothetical protein
MTTDRSEVDRVRAELADTLSAIEHKLNVPKRTGETVRRLRDENPIALAGIVAGSVAAVAGAVVLAVRLARR